MNSGQNSPQNRAHTRKAPARRLAGDAGLLSLRLERICKSLQLFARYCEQVPGETRAEVKQYLDLAEIELAEALRTLKSEGEAASPEHQPATPISSQAALQSGWTVQSTTTEASSLNNSTHANAEGQAKEINDHLLEPAQDGVDVDFDSLAEQAGIPEANDLEAILARLKSCIENPEAGEASESASRKSRPTDARELLLGFDVCKLAGSETASEPETSHPDESTEASTRVYPGTGMNDDSNSWFPSVSADFLAGIRGNETRPTEVSDSPTHEEQPADASNGDSLFQTDSHVNEPPSAARPANEETQQAENPHSSNSGSHSRHERSENSSPLQSISPDNLKQILELKEELNELLASYKSPQPNS